MIDIGILIIIGLSVIISICRGLISEVLSLVIWGLAIFFAAKFYKYVDVYFIKYIDNSTLRLVVSVFVIFIVILIIGAILSYIISGIIKKSGLTGIDRILGIIFGLARGVLVVALLLFILDTFTPLAKSAEWQSSQLIPYFTPIIKWGMQYVEASSSFVNENLNILK